MSVEKRRGDDKFHTTHRSGIDQKEVGQDWIAFRTFDLACVFVFVLELECVCVCVRACACARVTVR